MKMCERHQNLISKLLPDDYCMACELADKANALLVAKEAYDLLTPLYEDLERVAHPTILNKIKQVKTALHKVLEPELHT